MNGDANQLAALARTYRVAYTVKKGPPYEVMHSNAVFFFDKDGKARLQDAAHSERTPRIAASAGSHGQRAATLWISAR